LYLEWVHRSFRYRKSSSHSGLHDGYFVNYFNCLGREWQVYLKLEVDNRKKAENVGQFYVRNNDGDDVPLSALTKIEPRVGPEFTLRYNEYRSAQINGSAAPGYSSGQAM